MRLKIKKLKEKGRILQVAKNTINDLNKKIIILESKVESWKHIVNEIIDFISDQVEGLFGNMLKNKYKDFTANLREKSIITENEYKRINNISIKKITR